MLNILGAFFKNGYAKLIKGYFSHTGCQKKENGLVFFTKKDIFGHDQNIGFPKKFFLCDVEHSRGLFSNMDKLS